MHERAVVDRRQPVVAETTAPPARRSVPRLAGLVGVARLPATGAAERAAAADGLQATIGNRGARHVLACRDDAGACHGRCPSQTASGITMSRPGDPGERDAERIAARVLRTPDGELSAPATAGDATARRAEATAAGTDASATTASGARATTTGPGPDAGSPSRQAAAVVDSPGAPLEPGVRRFMEPRFGADFGDVRVHTDAQATATATALGARAYTMGASIVFGPGEYAPGSPVGRRLLAHELAHVVQQRRDSGLVLQRAVRRGRDHGGHYAFDDEACTLTYHQDWFFTFETGQDEDERRDYMAAAREQVRDAWSGQFPLLPVDDDCACPGGVDVVVRLRTHEGERDGAHGYDVVVRHGVRAMVNPVIRRVLLSHDDDAKKHFGPLGGQGVIAHEFGHTIGRPDEYNTWARVLRTEGAADEPSIMHHGNQARLRHYQHFADLLSHELGGDCVFRPLGVRLPEHEIPARRMTGFPQPLSRLLHEQRLSNQALLGLMHPTAGAARVYDLRSGRFEAGPTVGGWLNRLRHPLFVDLHTGLLFAEDPSSSEVDVRVPVSANVGLRRGGYQFGAGYTLFADLARDWRDRHELGLGVEHRGEAVRVGVGYTAVLDELRGQGWSHLVGVGIDVDLDRLLP